MITQDRLKELLHYCPETGVFTWKSDKGTACKGSEAGCVRLFRRCGKSYRQISVHNRCYQAHRLAFLYMTGEFPEDQVDHIDGNGLNNIWTNLRPVTCGENHKNTRKNVRNISGVTGVAWAKARRKWYAYISVDSCNKHLGYFHDKEEAIAVRKAAEVLYGFHENHGTERPL